MVTQTPFDRHLARLYAQLPFVDAIRAADATGRITHGINLPRGVTLNVADRDYFVLAKAAPSDMVISAPLVSRATGRSSLVFARRVDLPDGAGAVALLVDPAGHPVGLYSTIPLVPKASPAK